MCIESIYWVSKGRGTVFFTPPPPFDLTLHFALPTQFPTERFRPCVLINLDTPLVMMPWKWPNAFRGFRNDRAILQFIADKSSPIDHGSFTLTNQMHTGVTQRVEPNRFYWAHARGLCVVNHCLRNPRNVRKPFLLALRKRV